MNDECPHEELVIDDWTTVRPSPDGPIEESGKGYYCVACGEPIEGNPEEDRKESIAEANLMELLGK